jgi:hypothetical protein
MLLPKRVSPLHLETTHIQNRRVSTNDNHERSNEMITQQERRALFACSILVAICIIHTVPVAGQRWWHQGDTWLKWKHDVREGYVFGYFVAYAAGHEDGCKQGGKNVFGGAKPASVSSNDQSCTQQDLDFSKGSEYFVKQISNFYTRYPGDREIDIGEVLPLLAKGLTLEEIHNHPFPRRRPPPSNP